MNKRLMQALLLFVIMVSLSMLSVTDIDEQNNILETESVTSIEILELQDEDEIGTSEYIFKDGWTSTNVNIRTEPSINSEILEVYYFNKQLKYCEYNDEWAIIEYQSGIAYMCLEYISNTPLDYKEYIAPITSGFKSFMPYTTIKSKISDQYKLQKIAYTGTYGIRMANNRYCIAIGTAFTTEIGTYVDLVLENGEVIQCIVGDVKADEHTDGNNMITIASGCLTEFIIDSKVLNEDVKLIGDISYCCEEWNSRVEKIRVYEKNVFEKGE